MGAVRKLFTLGILLTLALPGVASALPAPARLGDLSFGLGPAFVVDRGEALGGVTGETNLLFGLFSLGVHGRVAQGRGDLHAAVGVEASAAGLLGVGASYQREGFSIDGLLAVPLIFGGIEPWFVSVGYRPSILLRGGSIHEIAVQFKWSSLLLPLRD